MPIQEWEDEDQFPVDEEAPALYFASLEAFVEQFIVPVFRRKVEERAAHRWAPDWWRYPEAVVRLEALWRAWEHLRLDPALGMSVWLRDHADHHLGVLFSPDGPFSQAKGQAKWNEPLPYEPPPPGLFGTERDAAFPDGPSVDQGGQDD